MTDTSTTARFDFHCHSTASDGRLPPAEVVTRAHENGVTCLSLTDHDTVAGLIEAHSEAEKIGLRLIPGIELSVSWRGQCFHVVGLDIDPNNAKLKQGMQIIQKMRELRAQAIGARLQKKGIPGCYEGAKNIAGKGTVTRTHFAQHLVNQNYATGMQKAFDRYLLRGKPGFVATQWPDMKEAIEWIRDAGGIAVLAHPLRYKITATRMRSMLQDYKLAGGRAIEVVCGSSNDNDVLNAARLARQFELLGSVGSDFHSPENRWIELGRLQDLPNDIDPVWNAIKPIATTHH